jgi:hypothetical protein
VAAGKPHELPQFWDQAVIDSDLVTVLRIGKQIALPVPPYAGHTNGDDNRPRVAGQKRSFCSQPFLRRFFSAIGGSHAKQA